MPARSRYLVHVLLGALLVRVVFLGAHALWLDEGATWSAASAPTWGDTLLAEANHPPVWYALTRAWIGLFGDSEQALRMPAALLGVLAVWLGWCLALRLLDPARVPRRGGFRRARGPGASDEARGVALWFAGFLAASAYFTEYAQEARMYPLLLVEGLGLALLYLRWLDGGGWRTAVGYAALGTVAMYTHYYAVWILAAHGVHLLFTRWRPLDEDAEPLRIAPMVLAIGAVGLAFLPWFLRLTSSFEGLGQSRLTEPLSPVGYSVWRMGVGPAIAFVDRERMAASGLGAYAADLPLAVALSLFWIGPLVLGLRVAWRRPGLERFLRLQVLVPLVAVVAVFPFFRLISERYLIYVAPYLWLLAVLGARCSPRPWRTIGTTALVTLTAIGAVAYHGAPLRLEAFGTAGRLGAEAVPARLGSDAASSLGWLHHGHPYGREPWRQAEAFIRGDDAHPRSRTDAGAGAARGDLVLLHPGYLHLVWDYYNRGRLETVALPRTAIDTATLLADFGDRLRDRTRVFLVLSHEETADPNEYVGVVRTALLTLWTADGSHRFQVAGPILFDRAAGVRVVVFNRRSDPDDAG